VKESAPLWPDDSVPEYSMKMPLRKIYGAIPISLGLDSRPTIPFEKCISETIEIRPK
jgi:hypothetical protein